MRIKTAAELQAALSSLVSLLRDCVNPDPASSSIGFRAPLSEAEAEAYWRSLLVMLEGDSEPPTIYLFVLYSTPSSPSASRSASPSRSAEGPSSNKADFNILGTVQLHTIPKQTHAHRAEVAKLLVRPSARRIGLGSRLMAFVETYAREELGKQLLTLDTASLTPARAFYNQLGWKEWGTCPGYADYADGARGDTTFFVKSLG